jgi:hypothetical protein
MTFFPRTTRAVTPLSAGVESLLRGMPSASPVDSARAKMSLLAAYERGLPREGSAIFRALRIAVPAGAVAASLVLGVGWFRGPGGPPEIRMERRGDLMEMALAGDVARLPVVDRPRMPIVPGFGDGPDAP